MAGLTVVITTNGVVQSTYDDGTPADMFSGKLPILNEIFKHIDNKDLLPREQRLAIVKFYISNDPLCLKVLEVTNSYLKNILKYVKYDVLETIPIEQQKDVDVNKLIEDSNKISENYNFDKEQNIEIINNKNYHSTNIPIASMTDEQLKTHNNLL